MSWENTALLLTLRGLIRALFVAFVVAFYAAVLVGCQPREPIHVEVWQPVDCQVAGLAGKYRTTVDELTEPGAEFLRVWRVSPAEAQRNVWIPRERVEVCEVPGQ